MPTKKPLKKPQEQSFTKGVIIGFIVLVIVGFSMLFAGTISEIFVNGLMGVSSTTPTQEEQDSTWMDNYKPGFIAGCKKSVRETLPDETKADTYCNCAVSKFTSRYSVSEIKEMFKKMQDNNNKSPEELTNVFAECAEQVTN